MLVHPDYRCQGIGTLLMRQAIDYLNSKNIDCICLDATPMGQPVYESLGFQTVFSFHRWQWHHEFAKQNQESRIVRSVDDRLRLFHYVIDHKGFGCNRQTWLDALAADSSVIVSGNGFGMLRRGRIANYLGPLVAENVSEAIGIANQLLELAYGDVFLDYPGHDHVFLDWLSNNSFSPVRTLHRMWFGRPLTNPIIPMQFAISDPATG